MWDKMRKQLTLLICWGLFFSSCVPGGAGDQKRKISSLTDSISGGTTGSGSDDSGGKGAAPGSEDSIINTITSGGKQELRHIIDPFDGTYKTKVTIPKNYSGKLHLSGLNFSSLKDRIISARFRFGQEREEVVIEGVIGRVEGGGITPQTDIQMLTLDMTDQPFKDIRLNYDLYDYNDYDTDDDNEEFDAEDDFSEPVSDYRDSGLFCRGLNLEDDPTFQITATNDKCDAAGERCLYSYAKVLDSGLYYLDGSFNRAINPTEPAIELGTSGYAGDSQDDQLKKCLPDTWHRSSIETALQTTMNSSNVTIVSYGDTGFGGDYTYNGPFRTSDRNGWEISGDALFSDVSSGEAATGLFQYALNNAPTPTPSDPNLKAQGGVKSFLFPRSGRLDLSSGIQYIGFTDLTDPLGTTNGNASRTVQEMISSGDSDFVDGCSIRKMFRDRSTGEGISSCNVTATIDLIYTDESGSVVTLASSREIKLQLARASETDKFGNEVLSTSLKACSSSNACGANECCFNNRCWSNNLVAQCLDNDEGYGNLTIGDDCSSDLQCSSLCCGSTGKCSVHVNNEDEQVLCSKSPGQFCVSKEFCRLDYVDTCFLVKTGGNSCGIRCYKVPTFGDCINGRCQQPTAEEPPEFDETDPDCSRAVDPPTEFDPVSGI
jgi:hypothetical protein